ncbi:hypothetical protein E4T42_09081 [Aureobasidium subglaciale]|nr:hypothetical protein E4T42_09081 [Aureobasidium subglaciale]
MGWSTHASGTQDPPEVRNWKTHLVAFVASMSALAMGYDTSVIGGTMALDSFRRDFGLADASPSHRDTVQGNIVSTFQAGCFLGALLTFPFAEKYRLPVYISETAPPSSRGRLIGIFEIASQRGGMLGFWINYATDRTVSVNNKAQWIIPLALQLVQGALLCIGKFFCLESPRWLARGDNFDKAEKIISNLRNLPPDHPYIRNEMNEICIQVEERSTNKMSKKQQVRKLSRHSTYHAPRIFESLGVPGTSLKLFSTGFYGISKTLGMITFTMVVVERVGRRKGLIWGAALGCVPMLYIGGYVLRADPLAALAAGDTSHNGWGYLAMVCVYVNAFIICATWQGITWTYASEIFPMDIHLGYGAYFFFGVILIAMGIWSFFFVPETKGITLEEMDALFARSVRKAVWAQPRGKPIPPMDEDLNTSDDAKKHSTVRIE